MFISAFAPIQLDYGYKSHNFGRVANVFNENIEETIATGGDIDCGPFEEKAQQAESIYERLTAAFTKFFTSRPYYFVGASPLDFTARDTQLEALWNEKNRAYQIWQYHWKNLKNCEADRKGSPRPYPDLKPLPENEQQERRRMEPSNWNGWQVVKNVGGYLVLAAAGVVAAVGVATGAITIPAWGPPVVGALVFGAIMASPGSADAATANKGGRVLVSEAPSRSALMKNAGAVLKFSDGRTYEQTSQQIIVKGKNANGSEEEHKIFLFEDKKTGQKVIPVDPGCFDKYNFSSTGSSGYLAINAFTGKMKNILS